MKTELLLKKDTEILYLESSTWHNYSKIPIHKPSIANFQRCEHVSGSRKILCHQGQAWMKSQLTLCLLLLMTLQLYHLAPPLPPPVSNSSCLFTCCQPLYASYHTVCFKVLYCKFENVFFIFCVWFLCIACVKSITNLLPYGTKYFIVLVGYLG